MMQELIERLEAANGPDEELDRAIAKLLWQDQTDAEPKNVFDCYQNYTSSIDAALTLAPDLGGQSWVFLQKLRSGQWQAALALDWDEDIIAPTAPLALCIAALKAREQ